MLSKRKQREYVRGLKAQIAKYDADESIDRQPLSEDAKLLKEKGIVNEQWEPVGSKIEYSKSKLERDSWKVPGSIMKKGKRESKSAMHIDDEEEPNQDQDDLPV